MVAWLTTPVEELADRLTVIRAQPRPSLTTAGTIGEIASRPGVSRAPLPRSERPRPSTPVSSPPAQVADQAHVRLGGMAKTSLDRGRPVIEAFDLLVGLWLFVLGAVIGSFANVCIYRIPWQKSVIWPSSHCPACLNPVQAFDNIPILSWLILGGRCRKCGSAIAGRYALIEFLVASLFVAVFLTDVVFHQNGSLYGVEPYYRMAYHQSFLALLVIATFIDYDLQIIPDEVTVTGILIALLGGMLLPEIRPEPDTASTWLQGLGVGVVGLLYGAGLTQGFRWVFSRSLGREAMGFGDVTLMAMIGAYLGWEAAILAFFLAPFFGILHAAAKVVSYIRKRLTGHSVSSVDREMPFGPYLSMAAATLMLLWPWIWENWAQDFYRSFRIVFWYLVTGE